MPLLNGDGRQPRNAESYGATSAGQAETVRATESSMASGRDLDGQNLQAIGHGGSYTPDSTRRGVFKAGFPDNPATSAGASGCGGLPYPEQDGPQEDIQAASDLEGSEGATPNFGATDGPSADGFAAGNVTTQAVVSELWTTIQATRQQLAGGAETSVESTSGSAFVTVGSRPPSPTEGISGGVADGEQILDPSVANRLLQMSQEAPLLYGEASGGAHLSHSGSSDSTTEAIQAEVRRQIQLVQHEHSVQLNALAEENLAQCRELMGQRTQNRRHASRSEFTPESPSAITAKPLQDFPEVQFRISVTRASLQVDVLPTSAKVDQLHRHLLSEMEALVG